MKYVIDRIEGVTAVCAGEDGKVRNVPMKTLYDNAKEGDHFREEDGLFTFDAEATEAARRKNILLQNVLFDEE